MQRNASAIWQGGIKDGNGKISTGSGVLDNTAYSYATRFEQGKGTNPEELIAAAHAGCFSMALSLMLGEANFTAERIDTKASVNMDPEKLSIDKIHLELKAKIPGIEQAAFEKIANDAKAGCPVSKVLKADITLDAKLES